MRPGPCAPATAPLPRRRWLLLGGAVSLASLRMARAQGFPDRPIRIVIPFAPGGPTDVIGRPVAELMSAALGVSVVIDNRAGAGGAIGTESVARARPDGTTLLMTTGSHLSNTALNPTLPYDPIRDFAPIMQMTQSFGMLLVARPNLPAADLPAFIAAAKARPGGFSYFHAGIGNITHICGALLEKEAGIELLAVPFRGTGPAFTELMAGRIDIGFGALTAVLPHVREGRLRTLAFTGTRRMPVLPEVPSFAELGYPGVDVFGWQGLWAPAGTPAAVIDRINQAAAQALRSPSVVRIAEDSATFIVASSPAEFAAFQERDMATQKAIAERLGIKLE